MTFAVTEAARPLLAHGQRRDASKLKRIEQRLTAIRDDRVDGIGKPAPLRFVQTGLGGRASVSQGLDGVRKVPGGGVAVKRLS